MLADIQMSKFNLSIIRLRHALALLALFAAAMAAPALAGQSQGTLESGISSSTAKESALSAEIQADSSKIDGFQGNIEDLKTRLDALETTLGVEKALLDHLKTQLASARSRLARLQVELALDRKVLVAQVIAAYEDPPPSIVTVILEAHGFGDLIERVDDLKAIGQENATATVQVADARRAVARETQHLTVLTDSSERETTAVLVQRDEVAHLHLALLDHQLQYIQARDRKSTQLNEIRSHQRSLEKELVAIAVREYASQNQSFATGYATESRRPLGRIRFLPGARHQLQRRRRADPRTAPEHARQGAAPAPDRDLRLSHAAALGRGGWLRQRPAHARGSLGHAGHRRRAGVDPREVRPHAPFPRARPRPTTSSCSAAPPEKALSSMAV